MLVTFFFPGLVLGWRCSSPLIFQASSGAFSHAVFILYSYYHVCLLECATFVRGGLANVVWCAMFFCLLILAFDVCVVGMFSFLVLLFARDSLSGTT